MAQSQSSTDVHQDELCPPSKRYALMDDNKKVDLENSISLLFKESNNTNSLSQIHKAGRNSKDIVGMKILDWIITNEMKLMENYRLYAEVFGVDVPTTQSQPTESTQGTHRTTSAPRLCIHLRRYTRLTQPTLIPTIDEEDVLILQDTLQLDEGSENIEETVEVTSSPLRNDDDQVDPGTRLEPRSDKESPNVEKIANILQRVNAIKEEEESSGYDYELRRRDN
uniref:Uncharacterized protein n=1 Tax=Tanacetum cinerariifolium TaxID=118510 RepID=A0A6L2K8V9_TANCI|nr:hypothetical protein [Tanacetum cinerariifolium]